MAREKPTDGRVEVLDVIPLSLLASPGIGFLPLGVSLGRSLGLEIGADAGDGCRIGPNAARDQSSPLLFLNDPVITRGLDPASEGGITGREPFPRFVNRANRAAGIPD